jgi:hypothetical protein
MSDSLINTLQEFLSKQDINIDQELISSSLRELNFSQTLKLVHMIKDFDTAGVTELLNIDYDAPEVEEAYGSVGTQQPSASMIKAQTTKDTNNQRDFTNNQQDQQRAASNSVSKGVPGNINKVATGQGAARSVGADPDDVQRGQNAAQSGANQQLSNQNAQEIERLKQLAFGRR